jgi:DNA-binding NtrC family response regulator
MDISIALPRNGPDRSIWAMSRINNIAYNDIPSVLIVDDEIIERITAVEALKGAGFETVDACNVAEAVFALEMVSGIRVVLTDIDLRGSLDGIVLAACVDRRWPSVGIIMTSGKIEPMPGDVPSRACFLRKPYCEARMLATVRGMIEQSVP